mmetsp:Transcript_84727/g.243198  ORF Transcript_84727/g.243198 Transcript_84727/m.243198 type:complete len:385 (+) Transcript_84727:537-1691(+)
MPASASRPHDGSQLSAEFFKLRRRTPSSPRSKPCTSCSSGGMASAKNRILIVGCGTSYHAALTAEYLIEQLARIPVEVQLASEFRYKQPVLKSRDVLIVISNSGETTDAVECLNRVKGHKNGKDVLTVAVVNEEDSTLARESDAFLCVMAGEEKGVTSTKAFSSTVLAFFIMAVALGEACGTLPETEITELLAKAQELPHLVQDVIERCSKPLKRDNTQLMVGECMLWDIGCQNVLANNFIFLGRGFNFPIALEGAMKCKEIAYIHAEGYPAAEMKHGPIALIDRFMPVVVIAPIADPTYEKIKSNIEEVKARSGSVIAITEDSNHELDDLCEYVIRVPETHEYLMPLVMVIPLQLLAYMMGVLRGNEVDNPRGLIKTVSSKIA